MAKREYVKNLESDRDVAAEIEDQMMRIDEGFVSMTRSEKKMLGLIKQWNDQYKKSGKYSKNVF